MINLSLSHENSKNLNLICEFYHILSINILKINLSIIYSILYTVYLGE